MDPIETTRYSRFCQQYNTSISLISDAKKKKKVLRKKSPEKSGTFHSEDQDDYIKT